MFYLYFRRGLAVINKKETGWVKGLVMFYLDFIIRMGKLVITIRATIYRVDVRKEKINW